MTKEEAIKHLEDMKKGLFLWDMTELIDLCISALSVPKRENGIKYYKADDVIKVLHDNGYGDEENGADPEYMTALSDVRRGLDNISTYAVPEREKSEWIEKEMFDGDTAYECSKCRELFCLIDGTPADNLYNFCPHCGADMRGEI